MPEHFTCDACQTLQHVDLWCTETSNAVTLWCVHCCACDTHRLDDPGGTVVLDFTAVPPWRGLHRTPDRVRGRL